MYRGFTLNTITYSARSLTNKYSSIQYSTIQYNTIQMHITTLISENITSAIRPDGRVLFPVSMLQHIYYIPYSACCSNIATTSRKLTRLLLVVNTASSGCLHKSFWYLLVKTASPGSLPEEYATFDSVELPKEWCVFSF